MKSSGRAPRERDDTVTTAAISREASPSAEPPGSGDLRGPPDTSTTGTRLKNWFRRQKQRRDQHSHQRPAPVLDKRIPVDKGWAWIIVVACAVSHLLVVGYFRSFGIIFVAYQDTFSTSSAVTAWVPAIRTMTFLSVSPLAQALSNKYSSRVVVMTGALLSTLGLLLSSQARNILLIALSDGVIAGIGTTFALSPGLIMVAKYFKKYRPTANGLACAGGSLGMFIIPPLLRYLMDVYAVHGALMIFAGLFLHLTLCGAVYRPWEFYTRGDPPIIKPSEPPDHRPHDVTEDNDELCKGSENGNSKSENSTISSKQSSSDFGIQGDKRNSAKYTSKGPAFRRIMSDQAEACRSVQAPFFLAAVYESTTGMSLHSIPSNIDLVQKGSPKRSVVEMENGYCRPRLSSDTRVIKDMHIPRRPRHLSEGDVGNTFEAVYDETRMVHPIKENGSTESHVDDQGSPDNYSEMNGVHKQQQVETLENVSKRTLCYYCCPATKTSRRNPKQAGVKKKIFEFSLMKDTVFLSFLVGLLLGHYGFSNQVFFLPAYARDIGISKQNAAWMLSTIGISDLIGRVGCGLFANLNLVRKRYIHRTALTILGVCAIFAPLIKCYKGLLAYCCILGISGGAYVAMVPVVLVDLIGLEKISSGMGLVQLFQGLTVPIGAPLLGLIRDQTGSYVACFHIFAVTILLGVVVLWLEPLASRYEDRKKMSKNRGLAPAAEDPLIQCSDHSSKKGVV